MLLRGKKALITGVGAGLGRDIAIAMAKEGADLILVARSEKVVPQVVAEVEELGRRAVPVYGNIADPDDCKRIAAEAEQAYEGESVGLDILVNSAFHGGEHVRFEDADLDRWQRPMNINHFGTLRLTQAVLPQLKSAAAHTGDARIVMINTMSVQMYAEEAGSYAASKAALSAATKTLAVELGEYGIRVNAVHPGYIWGDHVQVFFEWLANERGSETTWEDIYQERAKETALGYLPPSAEIAGSVVFFASPLAQCVTGTSLPVNAGHWIAPSA